ncbi:FxsB family cyclophane-forming radical SAM/SPASM peptide maturase [Actinoplanes derwentensis]|uniref:Radical SAM core domain-containing protein n=1 Tax=Actinoplanes derwentensis TaxID=113562 RepID=A0A1H1T2A6_9ACTN|nr:FxsB family cyclophane-forming radical SAM/SPASM peptide maturase [Actinoplanes derwentensis]GID89911.1 hypothetical protein Ade03nite_88350 [Actinoplanes derwentensis]SDS54116.1 uncharacterized protein SAMN04489716_1012 [Actinoplanes derwentensis]
MATIWPDQGLDVATLLASGWRPTPVREVVLKVHQRCNLACDYCYVYTMADRSWRDRPPVISREVWLAVARRMAEHAAAHDLPSMALVLHGGEPLLAGRDLLGRLIEDFRAAFTGVSRLDVRMQTNGTLLDEDTLELLAGHRVTVGVSLDGPADANDRRRRRADGRGSHADVQRALRLLGQERYRAVYGGLLCTIDVTTDPLECYRELLAHRPPSVDLLLPHANWQVPPPRPPGSGPAPYADWLITVFDRWYGAPHRETRIRLLDDLTALVLGGAGRSEQAGLSPVAVLIAETDGSIELVDSLKSAYPGACRTGLTVFADTLDAALRYPGMAARQIGRQALSDTCHACAECSVCGGGHYAHRFRPESGFRHPSVYCADIIRLIAHIRGRVITDLACLSPN